ncbi:glycosyltransferase [Mucilaginibacter aquariorum]|uniref:Glycosyltransferase family 4 protein n=1 Tax=Mucilaginibacter aquariorum TaxID=2967225 RepID=A0ABT1T3C5_9SPHI|nr:glycosyltransferase [Mucilaginibacter aquariorum]MCQ6959067.1 glycosyltransferase family 4 protein [Mucilaginibacter aquariorum]
MATNTPQALIILTPGFPANEADSTCITPLQIFVKALQQNYPGVKIIVLAFQYPFVAKKYVWNNVNVIAFGGKGRGKLFRLMVWFRVWQRLKKLNTQYKVMGLLSLWLNECAFIGNKFARFKGLKHYCWLLGQDAKAGNGYVPRLNMKGDKLIAISDFIVKEYHRNYNVKSQHVIPIGLDTSLFSKSEIKKDIDIIGVGSLIPLKQYQIFVEMVSLLKMYYPDIKAIICGDGPKMARLTAMIKSFGLEKNLILKGELPYPEILKLMQRSKILLHTSAYEGFGYVNLEALYAGASVVSFVKPMDKPILNWHIVDNEQHMLRKVKAILSDTKHSPRAILPYNVTDTAKAMMKLFGL